MCFSLTPSLLPRSWFLQGLITGVNIAIGYGLGVAIAKLLSKIVKFHLNEKQKRIAWIILGIAWAVLSIIFFWKDANWQNEIRVLVSVPENDETYALKISILAFVSGWGLINAGRGTRKMTRKFIAIADKKFPHPASVIAGVVATILVFVIGFNIIFAKVFVDISNNMFGQKNTTTDFEASQPTSSNRSGGPGSLVDWNDLGRQGRNFVGRGPTKKDLQKFSDDVKDPIRVYVGLNNASTPKIRADIAVRELERTKAFDREVLVIAVPTGSGWLEKQGTDSIEYIYGGDSAIVSTQYSYLPSWISFLVDKEIAKESGTELVNAVYNKWKTLPTDKRPKLLQYGLSLGSFGGQAAHDSIEDITSKVDGAMFVGTPNDTELWQEVTKDRDKGSPQRLPVYKEGRSARFASNQKEIEADQTKWKEPRVLYMQHGSDPIVWWSFDLILNRPDWLKEERAPDVSPEVKWYPFVTFWQLTVDQMFSTGVPNGYGHNYANNYVSAWVAIAQPDDWNSKKTDQLQKIIDGYNNE